MIMKRFFFFCALGLLWASCVDAQDFITRGRIEFEVKRNNKRMYAEQYNSSPPEGLPEFDISYSDLIFAWNQSVYQKVRKVPTPSLNTNESSVYTDLDKGQVVKKMPFGDEYVVYADSLNKIKWKIENETRTIAGWACRKAVGRIYDSVYVVAFYCPEIIPQSGPELFSGLPGMILGLAIPRHYTTWFATKIEVASVDESKIVPPSVKKAKLYTKKEFAEIIYKKFKDEGRWKDVTVEKVMQMLGSYTL
jgi:GLPGLI family protein